MNRLKCWGFTLSVFLMAIVAIHHANAEQVVDSKCPALEKLTKLQPFELYAAHGSGKPRDEINFVFCGIKLASLMQEIEGLGFYSALAPSPLKLIKETFDVFFNYRYLSAPMSHLYLFGRHEDADIEEPTGISPRRRHHARLWVAPQDRYGDDVIMMAASFDENIDVWHLTHKVSIYLDEERQFFYSKLTKSPLLKFSGKLRNFSNLDKAKVDFQSDGYAFLFETN